MSQAGTGSLQGGSGDEGGTSRGKVGDEVEQRPSAAFWGRDCTSNCHFKPILPQPRGLSPQGSLLPVSCSWGQTAPHRDRSISLSSGPCRKVSPSWQKASTSSQQLLTSTTRSYTLASVGSLVHTQWLPFPGLIFSILLLEILNWINPHRTGFFFCHVY